MTGFAPISNRCFNEPSLLIMLREELGLAVHQFGGFGFERPGDPRVHCLARTPKQHAISSVLHQRVLEQESSFWRRTALKYQPGVNKPAKPIAQLRVGSLRGCGHQLI